MGKAKKGKIIRIIWWVYLLALFILVILKFHGSISSIIRRIEYNSLPGSINYNLVPFYSIRVQLDHISETWAQYNLLGNILPFIPFGFLLPMTYKKTDSFCKLMVIGFLIILFFESFQYVTRTGSFDVDDIILNMIGIVFGYLMLKLTRKVFRDK